MFKFVLIFLALLIAQFKNSVNATEKIIPPQEKPSEHAYQPGCYIKKYDTVLPFNQTLYPKNGSCEKYICNYDGYISILSCAVLFEGNCSRRKGNLSLTYPNCCEYIDCKNDKKALEQGSVDIVPSEITVPTKNRENLTKRQYNPVDTVRSAKSYPIRNSSTEKLNQTSFKTISEISTEIQTNDKNRSETNKTEASTISHTENTANENSSRGSSVNSPEESKTADSKVEAIIEKTTTLSPDGASSENISTEAAATPVENATPTTEVETIIEKSTTLSPEKASSENISTEAAATPVENATPTTEVETIIEKSTTLSPEEASSENTSTEAAATPVENATPTTEGETIIEKSTILSPDEATSENTSTEAAATTVKIATPKTESESSANESKRDSTVTK